MVVIRWANVNSRCVLFSDSPSFAGGGRVLGQCELLEKTLLARLSYLHRGSSVRPSGVNFSHFPLLLQNWLMDLAKLSRVSAYGPIQVFVFMPDTSRGGSRTCKSRSMRGSFFGKLLLQTRKLQ